MNFFEFLVEIFKVISFDVIVGFITWFLYKFLDLQYFSSCEVSLLKRENAYLKEENRKINGTSTFFDEEDNI